jgi:hypothetical protein
MWLMEYEKYLVWVTIALIVFLLVYTAHAKDIPTQTAHILSTESVDESSYYHGHTTSVYYKRFEVRLGPTIYVIHGYRDLTVGQDYPAEIKKDTLKIYIGKKTEKYDIVGQKENP